jgi:uncharacterized iron-regulated membrane protein
MAWLHNWAGLLLGWLLFAIFLTGTTAYFQEETTRWMTPEIQGAPAEGAAGIEAAVGWLKHKTPDATEWSIYLPGKRASFTQLYWQNPPESPDGPRGKAQLGNDGREVAARDTKGGYFLYRFHYDLHYIPVIYARWIVGVAAMAMLVAILTGIVTHKKILTDFFLLRLNKGQRSWLDAHNVAGVLFLPFVLMITYTGLVTLGSLYMPWAIAANYADGGKFYEAAFYYPSPPERAGKAEPLAPIAPMVAMAETQWGMAVGGARILNPGDATARVILSSAVGGGIGARAQSMTFDGVTGRQLEGHKTQGAALQTESVMVGLHAGRYADLTLRALYFLSGIAGSAMIASGLVLWTVKRRARLPDPARPHFGFRLVETLNIGTIIGLPIGIAAYFLANRLLPLTLADRAEREIAAMFIAWGLAYVWAAARPPRRAWAELSLAAALAFAAVPLVSALTTTRGLPASLLAGDWLFVGFDLIMLLLASGFALAFRRASAAPKPAARPARRTKAVAA